MATRTTLLTAEEAASHAPSGRWELIRGEVVTYMPVQPEHARCVQRPGTKVEVFLDEYLAAGTELVWVIDPQMRTVHVFRPDAPIGVLRVGDLLDGVPVLPGFMLPVVDLFPKELKRS